MDVSFKFKIGEMVKHEVPPIFGNVDGLKVEIGGDLYVHVVWDDDRSNKRVGKWFKETDLIETEQSDRRSNGPVRIGKIMELGE